MMKANLFTTLLTALLILTTLFVTTKPHATEKSPKNDPLAELNTAMQRFENNINIDTLALTTAEVLFIKQNQADREIHFKQLDNTRNTLLKLWANAEVSTPHIWLTYSKDNKVKIKLNYSNNSISISFLHNKNNAISANVVAEELMFLLGDSAELESFIGEKITADLLTHLVLSAKTTRYYPSIKVIKNSALKQEINKIKQQSLEQKNKTEKLVDQLNTTQLNTIEFFTQADLTKKQLSQVKLKLIINQQFMQIKQQQQQRIMALQQYILHINKNHISQQIFKNNQVTTLRINLANRGYLHAAAPFIDLVSQQKNNNQISTSLLLALIQTESSFNLNAKSSSPAYGLMQLSPKIAGVVVNKFLFNKVSVMSKDELLLPYKNIVIGSAYLQQLKKQIFAKVVNNKSKQYCMLVAYNTGSGNLAEIFNPDKSRDINLAIKHINNMTSDEVYDYLMTNLPYEETKSFLRAVLKNQNHYLSLDKF